jgi:hypothetical protein
VGLGIQQELQQLGWWNSLNTSCRSLGKTLAA